jgi:Tol biopolymer transport system component
VWLAEADGSGARQVTRDGVSAENPVATPDGRWVLYASANPRTRGIMRIRPDGSDPSLLVAGNLFEPEVSPDGRRLAFVADLASERAALRVVDMAETSRVLFEVPVPRTTPQRGVDEGRCRWLPDGRGLVYVDRARGSGYAVYLQEFGPGGEARGGRRRLTDIDPDLDAESLGISRDGARLTISFREQLHNLMLAEDIPGLAGLRHTR